MSYERDNIARLHAYTPGEQPVPQLQQRLVKLNTNENPYPPCDAVMQAIRDVNADTLRRYPPPDALAFRQQAATTHGLKPEQIIATNGGDELLRLAVTVFCDPNPNTSAGSRSNSGGSGDTSGGGVAMGEPSYSLYPVLADIHDSHLVRVPLDAAFGLTDDFAQRVIDAGCKLAIIVNPHAPSGRLEPLQTLEHIARQLQGHAVLLVDEAYVDFAQRDALPLLEPQRGLDNVLLLRSLSKGYSLAGLRFGYGMGHASLIAAMHKARDSYNTDALSQAAAVAALRHREQARQSWRQVIEQRLRMTQELTRRGFFVYPSESNFILAQPANNAPDARFIYESLKQQSIFVRYFDQDRLRDKLRITIGTPEHNDILLAALDKLK